MCDPVTIGSIALTVASAGANAMAQNKVAGARNDAMAAERIRQKGLEREQSNISTKSQDNYQNFEGQQGERAGKLTQMFNSQTTPLPQTAPMMPQSSSNLVVQNEAARRGEAKDATDQQGAALGQLRAFGDLLGDKTRATTRDSGLVDQLSGFKKGSSNVLAYELENANSKGNTLRLFGDVLGGLGKVGMAAGLSGGSTPQLSGPMQLSRGVSNAPVSNISSAPLFQLY